MAETLYEKARAVPVIEADIFDRMNETRELIAQRAYEIYQARGGRHGFDQDDWFAAEKEILPPVEIDFHLTDEGVQLTAPMRGFEAADLEVILGHRRAAICGVHTLSGQTAIRSRKHKRIMRIVELPFGVNPALANASLQSGILRITLPRLR